MSELVWASRMMRERIAPPGSAGGKVERIRDAALRLQWKFSRARDVWYADERVSIKPGELRKIEEMTGVRYGQKEVGELDQLISRADALLMGHDPDFYSAFVSALREALRSVARARTEG